MTALEKAIQTRAQGGKEPVTETIAEAGFVAYTLNWSGAVMERTAVS